MKSWQPTEEHLLCRDLQHSWSPHTAHVTNTGFTRSLKCDRCDARKDQHLNLDGYVQQTSMTYPEGYLRSGEGRLTRDDRAALRLGNLS